MTAARTWLMSFLMLVAGGGVGVGLAAATNKSSASPPPPTTSTTRPPVQVPPTTAPQSGEDGQGQDRQDGLHGGAINLAPLGENVVLPPPGHLKKSQGRSVPPITRPPTTTPTTEPHTTTTTTTTTTMTQPGD